MSTSRRTFLKTLAGASSLTTLPAILGGQVTLSAAQGHELNTDVLIIGGCLGGIAAALAVAGMERNVIVTEETAWIGGQATAQGNLLSGHQVALGAHLAASPVTRR
jgi:NADPH-dependent 2,4-dienoyl-CoA reductase/sulfur reductase-like enzyme